MRPCLEALVFREIATDGDGVEFDFLAGVLFQLLHVFNEGAGPAMAPIGILVGAE